MTEQFVTIDDESCGHRWPRADKACDIGRSLVAPPEFRKWMYYEPIKRNRQVQEKHYRGEPAGSFHARILPERLISAKCGANTIMVGSRNESGAVVERRK